MHQRNYVQCIVPKLRELDVKFWGLILLTLDVLAHVRGLQITLWRRAHCEHFLLCEEKRRQICFARVRFCFVTRIYCTQISFRVLQGASCVTDLWALHDLGRRVGDGEYRGKFSGWLLGPWALICGLNWGLRYAIGGWHGTWGWRIGDDTDLEEAKIGDNFFFFTVTLGKPGRTTFRNLRKPCTEKCNHT